MDNNGFIDDAELDLRHVIGGSIYRIVVHGSYIDFVISGAIHVIIRIKKDFEFSIDGAELARFKLEKGERTGTLCYNFIELLGKDIDRYYLSRQKLEIVCIDYSRIIIYIYENDFESVEIIGVSGPHGNKLEFHHVL